MESKSPKQFEMLKPLNSLAVCEVRLVSCSHASAFGGGVVWPAGGGGNIFLSCSHALPMLLLLSWIFHSMSRALFSCLCSLSGWLFWLRICTGFLRNHTNEDVKYTKYKRIFEIIQRWFFFQLICKCLSFMLHYHRIAGGTEPVTVWHLSDLWSQAEHVPSMITAIT